MNPQRARRAKFPEYSQRARRAKFQEYPQGAKFRDNRVLFSIAEIKLPPWTPAAESYIKLVLETLGLENWELSVLFCNNRYIKTLNEQYRNKDEATDILSFPLGETAPAGRYIAGDIVISLDALEENSRAFNVSADEELRRLLVHGVLHLSGYDHGTNEAGEPMLEIQEKILASLAENIL